MKEAEANGLLDFNVGALSSRGLKVADLDIASAPEIIHVLLLIAENTSEALSEGSIQRPFRPGT
jgi:hypothetical protein